MIKLILSLFGYVKIPTEVVILSMHLEHLAGRLSESNSLSGKWLLKDLGDNEQRKEINKILSEQINGQKSLTLFLRSGKLLNKE